MPSNTKTKKTITPNLIDLFFKDTATKVLPSDLNNLITSFAYGIHPKQPAISLELTMWQNCTQKLHILKMKQKQHVLKKLMQCLNSAEARSICAVDVHENPTIEELDQLILTYCKYHHNDVHPPEKRITGSNCISIQGHIVMHESYEFYHENFVDYCMNGTVEERGKASLKGGNPLNWYPKRIAVYNLRLHDLTAKVGYKIEFNYIRSITDNSYKCLVILDNKSLNLEPKKDFLAVILPRVFKLGLLETEVAAKARLHSGGWVERSDYSTCSRV